jgi:hypothetical protein
VNYDEFNTEYTRVLDKINSGGCGPAELAALGQMLDVSRRTNNREDVWTITSDAVRRASSGEGTVADRIGRIEASIGEITSLANRNPEEREALMQSTSTLRLLHSSLQSSLRAEQAEADATAAR